MVEVIGPDLVSRNSCNEMFDDIETKKDESIFIDFAGVSSISRSFAHQYILRKHQSVKDITELNIQVDIKNMMSFVQREVAIKRNLHKSTNKDIPLVIH